jgi:hypothetical protein
MFTQPKVFQSFLLGHRRNEHVQTTSKESKGHHKENPEFETQN